MQLNFWLLQSTFWLHGCILQFCKNNWNLLLILITVVLWVLFPEMNLGLVDENKRRWIIEEINFDTHLRVWVESRFCYWPNWSFRSLLWLVFFTCFDLFSFGDRGGFQGQFFGSKDGLCDRHPFWCCCWSTYNFVARKDGCERSINSTQFLGLMHIRKVLIRRLNLQTSKKNNFLIASQSLEKMLIRLVSTGFVAPKLVYGL